jgi:hypothetical protein
MQGMIAALTVWLNKVDEIFTAATTAFEKSDVDLAAIPA